MTTHLSEERLILHYYGEPDEIGDAGPHLAECEYCRGQYQTLVRTLNSVDVQPVPERGPDYEDQVWNRLKPAGAARKGWRSWFAPRRWVAVGSLAALMTVAFLAGRFYPAGDAAKGSGAGGSQVRERVLIVALGDHLERTQVVLAELVNSPNGGGADITGERLTAESLLTANRLYRQTATATGESSMVSLLDDLERVLLEIAHSPERISGPALEEIRQRIESQGLLFKVRITGSRLREKQISEQL